MGRRQTGKIMICMVCGEGKYLCGSAIRNGEGKYCSRSCHYQTIVKHCETCGKEIKAKKSRVERKRFCSRSCNGKATPLAQGKLNNVRSSVAWNKGRTGLQVAWNKGVSWPDPIRAKMGLNNIGRPAWNKGLRGYKAGSEHHNWKGGITPVLTIMRHSWEYKEWRTAVFTRDDYTCQACGIRGGILNADHIKRFADFPELRLDVANGRTLCEPCHRKTVTYGNRKNVAQFQAQ